MELNGQLRRIVWRLGRKLYCTARGEGANQMDINGEAYVQERVLAAAKPGETLTVFDVGANLGEWTQSLIDQGLRDREKALDASTADAVEDAGESSAHVLDDSTGGREAVV